jgi:hypothetical protein
MLLKEVRVLQQPACRRSFGLDLFEETFGSRRKYFLDISVLQTRRESSKPTPHGWVGVAASSTERLNQLKTFARTKAQASRKSRFEQQELEHASSFCMSG